MDGLKSLRESQHFRAKSIRLCVDEYPKSIRILRDFRVLTQTLKPVPFRFNPGLKVRGWHWSIANQTLRLEFGEDLKLGDVVEHDERGEDQQHNESCLVDPLLELLIQIAAHDLFNQQQNNHPAIQNRNGQKIEDAKVEADDGHQADNRLPPGLLDSEAGFPSNPDWPTQVLHGETVSDHAVKDLEDQAGITQVEMNGLLQSRR